MRTEQDTYVRYVEYKSRHEAVWVRVAHALLKPRMPALQSFKVEIRIDFSAGLHNRGPFPPSHVCCSMNDCIEGKLATLESQGVTVQVIIATPGWSRTRLDALEENMANVAIS